MGKHKNKKKGKVSTAVKKFVKTAIAKDFEMKALPSVLMTGTTLVDTSLIFAPSYPIPMNASSTVNPRFTRYGSKIKIFEYDALFTVYNTGALGPAMVRILTIYDKGCQALSAAAFGTQSTSTLNNFWDNSIATAGNACNWYTNPEHVGAGSDHRFRILDDKFIAVNSVSPGISVGYHQHRIRKHFKNGLLVEFSDASAGTTNFGPTQVESGMIWTIIMSNVNGNGVACNATAQLKYKDME